MDVDEKFDVVADGVPRGGNRSSAARTDCRGSTTGLSGVGTAKRRYCQPCCREFAARVGEGLQRPVLAGTCA